MLCHPAPSRPSTSPSTLYCCSWHCVHASSSSRRACKYCYMEFTYAEHFPSSACTCRCITVALRLPEQLLKALSHLLQVSYIRVHLYPEGCAGLGGVGQGACQADGHRPVIPAHNLCQVHHPFAPAHQPPALGLLLPKFTTDPTYVCQACQAANNRRMTTGILPPNPQRAGIHDWAKWHVMRTAVFLCTICSVSQAL